MSPYAYALLAQEAYAAKPDIGAADSASRAIIRNTADGLVVAFPGSDNFSCWEADFDAEPVEVGGVGKLHRGFWSSWQTIAADVMKAIDGQPVSLVGHSLGGAIAVCAAVSLVLAGKPPIAVYAYEPPRVSPDLGVRTLLAKMPVHLYWNGLDIVPSLPPDWQHAALPMHIGKPSLPFPNTLDHDLGKVIAALA